ncbi:MAG: cob(I)yrinic acid a,c-diamide adenosyltransferase [Candidatus Korarchaeota archaeon]|nr:cob(I)yrinic acid a,c-diamide adenosyltransferase [Candidatus Korarchaeota archaeon]NIU83674.1 cob(I)yrinic acid a,c-diamide adenosyltransferase [Candidatus Thorarchaeota archaeon]NIW13892.1 cob(I)yrinic acid a,c-diamide adenosyltransferase [Candidatus Thorarchaeota archaeon]NIW51998.1 cob(I)yrinic acid a,c-diamide adenosyltransferase [Candidatus Korarchaeota archaeon]
MTMGDVYVYTGTGAGKTTNALGLALRTVGWDKKSVIIQFLTGRKDIGEYRIRDKLKPYYEIHQFGREEFIDPENPTERDRELAKEGLHFAQEKLEEAPDLLVLDEINYAVAWNLLDVEEVLHLLERIPDNTTVVLTGRYAPEKLIERAEFVNEVKEIKSSEEMPYEKGIQY